MATPPPPVALSDRETMICRDFGAPYALTLPVSGHLPLIVNSPHSGRIYPPAFREASRLDALTLRRSEDAFVDDLFAAAPQMGAPMLAARFPRAWVDVNRERGELDPSLFDGPLPRGANSASARVLAGLGVIPRVVSDGESIYARRLPLREVEFRLENFYDPFHTALAALIDDTRLTFGSVLVLDCHSMPSHPGNLSGARRPDIIVGNRFGSSARQEISATVGQLLGDLGFVVHFNRPYAGGYITEHYGAPSAGVNVLQLEINRALYLNERSIELRSDFAAVRTRFETFLSRLCAALPALLPAADSRPGLAAE